MPKSAPFVCRENGCDQPGGGRVAEAASTELGARRKEHPAGLPAAPAAPHPIHLPRHGSHRDLCKTEARSCQSRLSFSDVPHCTDHRQSPSRLTGPAPSAPHQAPTLNYQVPEGLLLASEASSSLVQKTLPSQAGCSGPCL